MVNVVGLGYIGLPTALMLASHGVETIGTDYDSARIEQLNNWELVFEENGLGKLMTQAKDGGLRFSTEYSKAEIYIVAVPTPYDTNTKKIDASYVIAAVRKILSIAPNGAIIVVESTISPGTIDRFIRPLAQELGRKDGQDIHFAHAPERIIPGNMVYELRNNSRTIGADCPEIAQKIKQLYASFCEGHIVTTSIRVAEMTKVVENTFRDVNIAFANELAKICHSANMDVYEIIQIANMHPRVNILQPGPGVGGHCISVDPWFLVGDYPNLSHLIHMARNINDSMPEYVLHRVYEIMQKEGNIEIEKVGLYGLTYKENVDDIRESPSLQLLNNMNHHLAKPIKVYDPYVKDDIVDGQYHNFKQFLNDVELVIVMVGHDEIKRSKQLFKNKIVFDTRNIFVNREINKLYRL